MSKGEKRVREESRVRMHVGACVAINAKGGDCWKIFNRQANGKYLTDIECLSLMASSMHKFRKIE
jgi:hypothetical protein